MSEVLTREDVERAIVGAYVLLGFVTGVIFSVGLVVLARIWGLA